MKNFLELAKQRYSVRNYKPEAIPEEDLRYVLEAGRIAPSAVNYQPWKFLVIQDPVKLAGVHKLYHREWFQQAPAVIILLADHQQAWKRADGKEHGDIDVSIAADHMTLAAVDRGLGTCWVCNFDKEKTVEHFGLPEHLEPVVFLPIGFPDSTTDVHRHDLKRKSLEEITWFEEMN